MEKLEEDIGDSVRPKNKFESQGERIQDSCKTSNDVQCRDIINKSRFIATYKYNDFVLL